jgi:hypothetical protein
MESYLRVIVLFFLFFCFGCSPAVTTTALNPYPPKGKDHPIRIYTNRLPVCSYIEVGIVKSRQRNKLISMDRVAESLREAAREMGGDAIIGVRMGDETMGAMVSGGGVFIDTDPVLQGTVIRWKTKKCTR